MKGTGTRKGRSAAVALLALAAASGGSACGSAGAGREDARPLAIQLSGEGRDLRFSAPQSVPAGLTQIEFKNAAKGPHDAQLVRADAGHTPEEALRAGGAWGEKGRPLPPWVHIAGGVGSTEPGASGSSTQELRPGAHVVVDLESNTSASFEVTGDRREAEPDPPPASITASEYKFEAEGLQSGRGRVLFDNQGAEPHFVTGAPIKPGKTLDDVRKFAESEKGESPVDESAFFSTTAIDGGQKQVVDVDLKKGRYALLCFVSDRKGGPPHAAKGMVSEATVR